ncbi:MAG: MATE family efflux transporter [Lachnospiraceae bacterium]
MKIQLSDHFSIGRLLRYSFPSIIMLVFTSIYSVVDGLFVSNVVGSNALSAINIISPVFMIVGAVGFMLGTGGSAEVSKTLGEGNTQKAREYFTNIILTVVALGILLSILGVIFIRPLAYLVGASDLLIEDCVIYGTIILSCSVFFMLQTTFQTFLIVAERPDLGMKLTILAGCTNMVLDYLFVYVLGFGIAGAAWATMIGCALGGILPVFFFFSDKATKLRFVKTKFYPRTIARSCLNGSSEMVANFSMSFVTVLFNLAIMKLLGETGVAAYTAMLYVGFLFNAIYIGFVVGIAPIISYHYGAADNAELKSLLKKSLTVIGIFSVTMFTLSQILAVPVSRAFSGGNQDMIEILLHGFRIYAIAFLFSGLGIFGSAFFTALCNGVVSAGLSFLRTLVLPTLLIISLPVFLGIQGVWLTLLISEVIATTVTVTLILGMRKKYGY